MPIKGVSLTDERVATKVRMREDIKSRLQQRAVARLENRMTAVGAEVDEEVAAFAPGCVCNGRNTDRAVCGVRGPGVSTRREGGRLNDH